jgi:hypothetical protein
MLRLMRDGERPRPPDCGTGRVPLPALWRAPRSHLSERSRPPHATSLSSCFSITNCDARLPRGSALDRALEAAVCCYADPVSASFFRSCSSMRFQTG